MPKVTKLVLPLHVTIPRKTKDDKRWILNMNNYTNTHFQVLNQAKIIYKKIIEDLVAELDEVKKFEKAVIMFVYYHPRNGRVDKSNPCAIIEKFACDALTELGFWDDDDSRHIPWTFSTLGGIDKNNPRCEMHITEMADCGELEAIITLISQK